MPIKPRLFGYIFDNTVRAEKLGLGMASKEILTCLFNPFNLKKLNFRRLLEGSYKNGFVRPSICLSVRPSVYPEVFLLLDQ